MQSVGRDKKAGMIPKRRQRHHSYDESVDEPAQLIAEEPVEVEAEVPAEENPSIERNEQDDKVEPPVFEEE